VKIAIVGFQGCGKTTVFKAVTGLQKIEPSKHNLGKVEYPDPRLEKLAEIVKSKKITFEELVFVDEPGFNLSSIKDIEVLMHVIGVFSGRNYAKDVENMKAEFILSDLSIVEKRLPRLEKEIASSPSNEKENEKNTLLKCKMSLDKNQPLKDLKLSEDEERIIAGYQFLSRKPIFTLFNLDDSQVNPPILDDIKAVAEKNNLKSVNLCAKIEAELQELDAGEREEFAKSLGLEKSARQRVIQITREVMKLVTFFTVKSEEAKAWPIPEGAKAIEAAGKIHTDIKKGFIKAEVINYNDFVNCGTFQEAKNKGLLKLEGKEYIVRDGDIIDFKFNV